MEVQITGIEQVNRRLAELPRQAAQLAFAKALDRAAGVVAGEVEARTPVGEEEELASAVETHVQVDEQSRGAEAAVTFSARPSARTGRPLDAIALWVEYGHVLTTHKGRQIGHVPPKPFIRPALEASGDRAIAAFADTFLNSLSDLGEGGGGEAE